MLTHVPLSPDYPNGFSERWHSFLTALGGSFALDVIGVRGVWDQGQVPQETFVPHDLGAVRVRLLDAIRPASPPKAVLRVVRSLLSLLRMDRFGPVVPGLAPALAADPPPALIVAFLHHMAEHVLDAGCPAPTVFVLEEGIERLLPHARPRELAMGPLKQLWKFCFWRAYHVRLNAFARAIVRGCARRGRIVAINEVEARAFARAAPGAAIGIAPMGVDVDAYAPQSAAEEFDAAVFGDLSLRHNYEPARELFEDVSALPGGAALRWAFVGREPHASIRALASDRVTVTGRVADTRPYYARTRVVVVPTRHVTGSKSTLVKACSMARPAVVTAAGLSGLPLQDGRDVVAASGREDLARQVMVLLRDEAGRRRLGAAARATIVRACNQAESSRRFAEICRDAVVTPLGVD
ncbi:MAG TPA: glycosyltransferase family 4 protein [Candidatus Binatia bacterium]|nr:glycosyltransferase family 4 protein [Candidatus Binatia bacterium]